MNKQTLSDKRMHPDNCQEEDVLFFEDVKEFINELKEEFRGCNLRTWDLISKKIDKLAGEKLK